MSDFLSHVPGKGKGKARAPAAAATSTAEVTVELPEAPPDPSLADLEASNPEYCRLCRRAAIIAESTGFEDIIAMDCVRRCGVDRDGRAVFLFQPAQLPEGVDLERVTMYAIHVMHEHVVRERQPYTAFWLCNNLYDSRLGFFWFRRTYRMLPHAYRKMLGAVGVIHPTLQVRAIFFLFSYFLKDSFWEKLHYFDRVEFLDELLDDKTQLALPKDVEYYERIVEKEARDAFRSEGGAAAAMYGGSNLLAGMGTGDDEPYDDADASLYAPKTAGASGDAVRRPAAGRRVIDDDADD